MSEHSSMPSRTSRDGRRQALIFLCLFLHGCMAGPNFVRPQATVSPDWLEAGDPRVKTEPLEYTGWWRLFDDPVLDRLIDRAYRENLSLQIAGVRVLGPAPPPPPPETIVVAPGPAYVWVGGAWVWFWDRWVWHHDYWHRPGHPYRRRR